MWVVQVFYVMAMAGLHSMTGQEVYRSEAAAMMDRVLHWAGPGQAELRPRLAGAGRVSSLATPMCLLSLLRLMEGRGWTPARDTEAGLAAACVQEILSHRVTRPDSGQIVLETVTATPPGLQVGGAEGRLVNPGHALECGWFLLDWATRHGDPALADTAITSFIEGPLEHGWDKQHGGIFYFLDAEGECAAGGCSTLCPVLCRPPAHRPGVGPEAVVGSPGGHGGHPHGGPALRQPATLQTVPESV